MSHSLVRRGLAASAKAVKLFGHDVKKQMFHSAFPDSRGAVRVLIKQNPNAVETWVMMVDAAAIASGHAGLASPPPGAYIPPKSALDVQVGGDHYKQFELQPAVIAEKNGLSFLEGCIVKRLHRYRRGGKGLQDLQKCKHEIELLINHHYGEQA